MGKLLKVLAVISAVVVIAISLAWYFTSGIVDATEQFFVAVKSGDADKIDQYLSAEFKARTGRKLLNEYLVNNALSNHREVKWSSRSVKGDRGYLMGTLTTASGEAVPLMVSLIKKDQGWKIYSLQKSTAGLHVALMPVQAPSGQALSTLISESMYVFANAVKVKNMQTMHRHISQLWQQQINVQQLNNSFKGFYPLGDALLKLKDHRPRLSREPSINNEGVLIVEGWYPSSPKKLFFRHQYVYEQTGWKLLGFNVDIK